MAKVSEFREIKDNRRGADSLREFISFLEQYWEGRAR